MKIAVVYYSLTGNVKSVANKISSALGADEVCLVPTKAYPDKGFRKFFWGGKSAVMGEKPQLEPYTFGKYDLVVLGTPVWASTFAPPLRTFIADNSSVLQGVPVAAFVCLSGGGGDKALAKLQNELKIDAFCASLQLINPLDKPTEQGEQALASFVSSIQAMGK